MTFDGESRFTALWHGLRWGPVFIVVMLISVASNVNAQSVVIGPPKNTNRQDVSSVWAECEPLADDRRMTCNFVQVRVDLAKTPEAAAAELEQQLRDTTPQQMATTCKDQRQEMAELAAKIEAAQDVPPRFKAFFTGWMQRFNAMCDKPTVETMRAYLWYSLQKETKTCRIWASPWQETLTKQSRDQWVSHHGGLNLAKGDFPAK